MNRNRMGYPLKWSGYPIRLKLEGLNFPTSIAICYHHHSVLWVLVKEFVGSMEVELNFFQHDGPVHPFLKA